MNPVYLMAVCCLGLVFVAVVMTGNPWRYA
jgi:hypothetical protein